jgi:ribose 5-phosphate isomerase A
VPVATESPKSRAASAGASLIRHGMTVGLGSGSTAALMVRSLAQRIEREHLLITAVSSSIETTRLAGSLGITVLDLDDVLDLDISLDGADEIDTAFRMIKGRGGALLREKIVMASSPERYVVVDESKLVDRLGTNFAVPIEVLPEAVRLVRHALANLGVRDLSVRPGGTKDGPLITEHGNLILDAWLPAVDDATERHLQAIPGVVECGLFIGYAPTVLVAR